MTGIPAPDRVDLGTLGLVVGLLFFALVVRPTQFVQASVWVTIVMIFVCWTGYFFYRMVYDEVEFWE